MITTHALFARKVQRKLSDHVAGFAAAGPSSDRKRSRPIRAFSATPRDGQRPCRTLAEDPGRTQPRAAYPGAAAQTRVVSMAAIRLGSWESARAFKGKFATTFLSSNLTCPATQSGLFGAFIPFMGFASSAVRFNGRATLGERWPFRLRATAALIRITWRDRRRDKTTARDFTRRRGPQTG